MRGMDSINAFGVIHESMWVEFRKLDFTLITGDSGVAFIHYRYILGLVDLYIKQISYSSHS